MNRIAEVKSLAWHSRCLICFESTSLHCRTSTHHVGIQSATATGWPEASTAPMPSRTAATTKLRRSVSITANSLPSPSARLQNLRHNQAEQYVPSSPLPVSHTNSTRTRSRHETNPRPPTSALREEALPRPHSSSHSLTTRRARRHRRPHTSVQQGEPRARASGRHPACAATQRRSLLRRVPQHPPPGHRHRHSAPQPAHACWR